MIRGKIFSLLFVELLICTCFTVIGTQQQKEDTDNPLKTIKDECLENNTLLNECDCNSPEVIVTDAQYYRTGFFPGKDKLPEGITLNGRMPSAWDWRDATYGGVTGDWTTPIKNQANCGSCYAFGTLASIESLIKIKQQDPELPIDISEQYMVSCGMEWMSGEILGCDGAYSPAPYDFVTSYGVLPESCFPYVSGSGYVPPCSDKCSNWEDLLLQIDGWNTVSDDITSIKNALVQYGPLAAGMIVYYDFFDYDGGVYEHPGSDPDDMNHLVAIVGYDDAQNCWICKNSWGTSWGEEGWFRITYGDCKIGEEIIYFDYMPQAGPQVTVKIHRILTIGDIEGWLEGEADWSYRVQVHNGDGWIEETNDEYSTNEDDHTQDVLHKVHVQILTPEITIKFWDRDFVTGDDLADVSGYNGGGTDDSINDVRGAIFHGQYNIETNQLVQIDSIIYEGGYATTSGTYQPDGGDNSDAENDAKVWFSVSDSYEPPQPDLEAVGNLNGSVKIGTQHYAFGSFTVENTGVDPYGLSDSYLDWEIAEIPDWGSNWVFEPNGGTDQPSGAPVTVQVYVDVPDEQGTFTGSIKIWNIENHADYVVIPIQLVAPFEQATPQWKLFHKIYDVFVLKKYTIFSAEILLR